MSATYQQLLQQWATLAPDECLTTERDYNFKVRILPAVEKRNSSNAWRRVSSQNIEWRLSTGEGLILPQLNFVWLTVIHQCAAQQTTIEFTFDNQGTTATICRKLHSQPHPHPAISALDAYLQFLHF
ncbi:hypothetical protein [Nodularia sp. NIES-3585]|uniref:hypothetical protein n=1 Tax=Nodularia sp. NIES-3585 TaxID=1973477 RepID=UPI000B5CAF91|nr:hypothetical protein [Nodularia sp. NIES-3585]GAX38936.1 hypothetical protein NIES3585_49880 [Nodularia sp. NIES-3585]